jgi:hypothetical protein
MKDTLEQLAAEVTAANDDLNLGNHDNDLQRLRELESDREDLIERINAREYRLQVARDALLAFLAPETQPEQSAPVATPESAGEAFNAAFQQTEAADAWTPEPRDTSWPVPPLNAGKGSALHDVSEAILNDDTPFPGCEPDENTQLHRTDAGETPGF